MKERGLDKIQESAWGKCHADFLWNAIEWQGKLLIWKVRKEYRGGVQSEKRGTVRGFSRSSRLRLFKAFNRIDWEKNMPLLFVTLTYPDSARCVDRWVDVTKEEMLSPKSYVDLEFLRISMHRWVFWRQIEKWAGGEVPCMWRLEWKPRKTGVFVDKPMPHLHMLIMGEKTIPWQEVRYAWQIAIGERFVSVDVRKMLDPDAGLKYLAKYLAKGQLCTLDDDAYLSSIPPGRCWGFMRQNLIRKCEKHYGRYFETDQIASLRKYASPGMVELIDAGMCSFTLIGEDAERVGELVFEKGIDTPDQFD